MGETILLVEDDASLRNIVVAALDARGYDVRAVENGRMAIEQASVSTPDLVILDLGLPDIDGVDVCRELRRSLTCPILVLSADGDIDRKVAALDEGADDYVTKPFSMPELLARIRAGLRLRHRMATAATPDTGEIVVGDLVIDVAAHIASVGSEPLKLAPKEFLILRSLAVQPGRLVTLGTLRETVWGSSGRGSPGALRLHILSVRKKLGTGPSRPSIVTQPAVGYRMLLPQHDDARAGSTGSLSAVSGDIHNRAGH